MLARVAAADTVKSPGVKSRDAQNVARVLLEAPRAVRRTTMHQLGAKEMEHVFREMRRETGSSWGAWHDDPVGFTEDVIGETVWDLQAAVMDALVRPGIKRVAVPAGFGVGKTSLVGRVVAWAGATRPVGTMQIVTTATRMRQVRSQMWPHIKTAVAKAGIPGRTDTTQWIAPDQYGNDVQIAYGFSASPTDEAAMQGIHGVPGLLLVVDEAGGIAPLIGRGTNNLLTGDARLLATGNPAMDDPGSWFEELCAEGEGAEEPSTITVRIAAVDSPAITGAPTPVCRFCTPNLDGHTISQGVGGKSHLPDWDWLMRTLRDNGATLERTLTLPEVIELGEQDGLHPYVVAKVFARFPKGGSARVIPPSWIEVAQNADEPAGEGYVALRDLGLPGEHEPWMVKRGSWVRLGIDVAAGGGDEFAVYMAVGDLIIERHVSSGAENANAMTVTDKALGCILAAERLAVALGSPAPVRVKVDSIGVGWGVVGALQRYGQAGRHVSQVVPVHVGEGVEKDRVDEAAAMRPWRKRDEMWLAMRELLQPDLNTGEGRLRLRVPKKTAVQLAQPNLTYPVGGFVKVESKDSMKARGVSSPDRAEAALLAVYEPTTIRTVRRRGLLT